MARSRNNKIVVLQGMFTLDELEESPTLLLDLKQDVREECEKLGEVTNVTLYDVRSIFVLVESLLELKICHRKSQTVS